MTLQTRRTSRALLENFCVAGAALLIGLAGCADARGGPLEPIPAPAVDDGGALNTSAPGTYRYVSQRNTARCIAVNGPVTSGTSVVLADCASGSNLALEMRSTGELRLGGLCVDAAGGQGRDGDRLILWGCHGGANQRWAYTSTGELRGINGKCADIPGGNTAAGTGLILWGCHGGSNQRWTQEAVGMAAPTVPSGAAVRECDDPRSGWIWCDDFETDRMRSYFEHADDHGSFVRATGVGRQGGAGMRARFGPGQVSAGSLKLAFGRTPDPYMRAVDGGTRNYREVYWRVFIRHQPGWEGGGGDKMSRATSLVSASWAQSMIAHVWSGAGAGDRDLLFIDPASGTDAAGNIITTRYNDFARLRWLGARRGTTPIFAQASVGQWYCVEARARLNDAGRSNGEFHLWVDGVHQSSRTDLNWVGSFDGYGINAVFLENYWNHGSPKSQERYFDNFVVSTERIGC